MLIKTENFLIRPMNPDDLLPLYHLLSDPVVMEYLEPPFSFEAAEQFLQKAGLCNSPLIWAVENLHGSFMGYVIYHAYDENSMELGWVLNQHFQGQGYAGALTETLLKEAEVSGKELVIECSPKQTASKRLAQKYAFRFCGLENGCEIYRRKNTVPVKIRCVWEHNGNDTILYADNFIGAFARGASLDKALGKLPSEIKSYLKWKGDCVPDSFLTEIVQEKSSELAISDADSDVLFEKEKKALRMDEYLQLKALALKSAQDFLTLYEAIPDKEKSCLPPRTTFYGQVPRTASEMYAHTKNVNEYYFNEIDISADNNGTILACRERGFALLEGRPNFLNSGVFSGSYGEEWSLRKVLRRFIWHDRIHAKAMYRMAVRTFGQNAVPDVFCFGK